MNESLLEYQIILSVYLHKEGRNVRQVVRSSDRTAAINKFRYLEELIKDKRRAKELGEWGYENLNLPQQLGQIVSLEGLFGVAYLKIL